MPQASGPSRPNDNYYNLGTYQRKVSTSSVEAQKWFDRGWIWCYGFNHEEAIACFERSIKHDRSCAMALWGLAYALGPNYNKPWSIFDIQEMQENLQRAHGAAQAANDLVLGSNSSVMTAPEKALVQAILCRYPSPDVSFGYQKWNVDFAHAMEKVYQQFPKDLDVATIYADALMNLTPWSLWDLRSGRPTKGSHALQIKNILERAFEQPGGMRHPGALHLYIHLMELSSIPEAALPAADALRLLAPDSGHLNHMPTHIDILCGDYRQTMTSNLDAIKADESFLRREGALNFYSLYRLHNYHFRIYGAMFAGQSAVALDTVARLEKSLPEAVLRIESPPMADWLEGFLSMRVHVLVRFGRWSDLLKIDLPSDQKLYCVTSAMVHYGKGLAFAATHQIREAEKERDLLVNAISKVLESRTLFNNSCRDILAVGARMLDGELEYRRRNFDAAFDSLREAVRLSDNLPYVEPWGWMQPTRHALGALLLENGRLEEAAAVYRADLGIDSTLPRPLQHPNNIWALRGYYDCLKTMNRDDEAKLIKRQLDVTAATADINIKKSCFCATASSSSL